MPALPRVLITAAVLTIGCRGSTSEGPTASAKPDQETQTEAQTEAHPDRAASAHPPKVGGPPGPPTGPDSDELPRLHGHDQSALRLEFGAPTFERQFTMSGCCHEFEVELYNHYPPDAGHDDVEILEWTWQFDGYKLTVWLHRHEGEWVTLETARYTDDTEF